MEAELSDKSLQEGEIRQPVAGYLYFPLPKEKGDYELEYRNSQSISYLLLNTP
jgi:hypothetical protein